MRVGIGGTETGKVLEHACHSLRLEPVEKGAGEPHDDPRVVTEGALGNAVGRLRR